MELGHALDSKRAKFIPLAGLLVSQEPIIDWLEAQVNGTPAQP